MEVDSKTMKSLEALANINLQVSEARTLLIKLQENETEYLVTREAKAIQVIEEALKNSSELIEQTKNNYNEVQTFFITITSYAATLEQICEKFESMLKDFNIRSDEWDKKVSLQNEEFAVIKRQILVDSQKIKDGKEANVKKEKIIKQHLALIESRQSQIKTALEVMKNKKNG